MSTGSDWYSGGTSTTGAPVAPTPYTSSGFGSSSSSTGGGNGGGGGTAAANNSYPSFAQPMLSSQQHRPMSQAQQQQQQQHPPMQAGMGFYQQQHEQQHPQQQQQQQQQPLLSGAMDSSASTMMMDHTTTTSSSNIGGGNNASSTSMGMPSFAMFMPSASAQHQSMTSLQQQQESFMYPLPDEAPLLEELGINVQHILLKTKAVVLPFSRFGGDQVDPTVICEDADMAGPIAFALLLGGEMLLSGKLQFGYIYGFGLFGCTAMTFVVNLITPEKAVSFWTVTSSLGYSLLPVNVLALLKIFVMNLINLQMLGRFLGVITVAWSTTASTRLLELGCGMRDQRYLLAYPIALLYSAFVMMTIF
jgi:hypothetical protein